MSLRGGVGATGICIQEYFPDPDWPRILFFGTKNSWLIQENEVELISRKAVKAMILP